MDRALVTIVIVSMLLGVMIGSVSVLAIKANQDEPEEGFRTVLDGYNKRVSITVVCAHGIKVKHEMHLKGEQATFWACPKGCRMIYETEKAKEQNGEGSFFIDGRIDDRVRDPARK